MEDLPGRSVAAFLEVGLHLDLPAVAGLVGQAQDVQGLGDPPVVGDRVAERGGAPVPGEHADDVVGADGAGVDGADDPQDVLPVPLDPRQVDPAAGRVLEGPVVRGAVDTPHLLIRQVSELPGVGEPGQGQEPEDDVAVRGGVGDDHVIWGPEIRTGPRRSRSSSETRAPGGTVSRESSTARCPVLSNP